MLTGFAETLPTCFQDRQMQIMLFSLIMKSGMGSLMVSLHPSASPVTSPLNVIGLARALSIFSRRAHSLEHYSWQQQQQQQSQQILSTA